MTPPDIKDIEAITKLVDKDGYDPEDLVAVLPVSYTHLTLPTILLV